MYAKPPYHTFDVIEKIHEWTPAAQGQRLGRLTPSSQICVEVLRIPDRAARITSGPVLFFPEAVNIIIWYMAYAFYVCDVFKVLEHSNWLAGTQWWVICFEFELLSNNKCQVCSLWNPSSNNNQLRVTGLRGRTLLLEKINQTHLNLNTNWNIYITTKEDIIFINPSNLPVSQPLQRYRQLCGCIVCVVL